MTGRVAEADIHQLTALARQMVGRWGMSDAVGPVALLDAEITKRAGWVR